MGREYDADHGSVCTSTESDGRKIADDRRPMVAGIGRRVDLAAGGAEINAAGIERVDGHGVAQHVHVAVALRQAVGERLPVVAAGAAAVDAQLSFGRIVLGIALDRHDIDRSRARGRGRRSRSRNRLADFR